jgi:hypothetical protein
LNFRLKVNMVIYVNKVNSDAQSKVDNSLVSCLKNVLLSISNNKFISRLAPINKPGYCLIVHVDHLPLDPNLLQDAMSHSEL